MGHLLLVHSLSLLVCCIALPDKFLQCETLVLLQAHSIFDYCCSLPGEDVLYNEGGGDVVVLLGGPSHSTRHIRQSPTFLTIRTRIVSPM